VGGNIKACLNYNINENHNLFVNSGYYSKQPFMSAVYPFGRNYVNDNLTNEKIVGMESGYGFHSSKFTTNLNLYRTTWKDRFQTVGDRTVVAGTLENPNGYFLYEGLSKTHQGVELDFNFKPINKLMVNGMLSYGN
jgi:outer membrane receptor for Fe3+-dicitrate